MLKVLHIQTNDYGGAGIACLRLHETLLSMGIDSKVLVYDKKNNFDEVYKYDEVKVAQSHIKNKLNLIRKSFLLPLIEMFGYKSAGKRHALASRKAASMGHWTFYTSPISDEDLSCLSMVKDADIIHLHWTANFLDYRTFFDKVNKPIIITVHDENIGLGGFHYTCLKNSFYEYYREIEDYYVSVKEQAFRNKKNISLIALTKQMNDYLHNVDYLKDFPIYNIYNSVDCDVFNIKDKFACRRVLNLPIDKKLILFVAQYLQDERKGFHDVVQVVKEINDENVQLIAVGNGRDKVDTKGLDVMFISPILDDRLMSIVYSAADFLVFPSYQESFGQTPIEAMACGKPVVGYPSGIMPELISKVNGILCEYFSVESLKDAVLEILNRQYVDNDIRDTVKDVFSPKEIAEKYINVYKHVLK